MTFRTAEFALHHIKALTGKLVPILAGWAVSNMLFIRAHFPFVLVADHVFIAFFDRQLDVVGCGPLGVDVPGLLRRDALAAEPRVQLSPLATPHHASDGREAVTGQLVPVGARLTGLCLALVPRADSPIVGSGKGCSTALALRLLYVLLTGPVRVVGPNALV